jgi:hypothetical protein
MVKHAHPCPPRREALVRWTARLGAITAQAAAVHLDVSVASARAQLHAAARAGLLVAQRPLAQQPALHTATRQGLRACGETGLDPCRVSASGARHLIVCAHVAAALERCYPDHALLGERELRRDERLHGRPLASAQLGEGHGGRPLLHRPDLVLLPAGTQGGLPVAVEVELTVKAPRRLRQICRAWARTGGVAGVLYLAPPAVRRALGRAIAQADAAEQIALLALDALPGLDADGACKRSVTSAP